jgi:hypothetical protein
MKKNSFLILGMLAMVLTFGIVAIGCVSTDNGSGKPVEDTGGGENEPSSVPKTIKIIDSNESQGITAQDIMLIFSESAGPEVWPPFAIAGKDEQTNIYYVVKFDGNWDWWDIGTWTGTGKFYVVMQTTPPKDSSKDGANYVYSEDGTSPSLVDIRDAVTTLELSKFIWLNDFTNG